MAGLLGQGWDDPQSNAIMQLAGGLLSGNFAQGAANYGATMAGAKDAAMKREFMGVQMDNYKSEIEARKLAAVKDARSQANLEKFMSGDGNPEAVSAGAFSPSSDGYGPVMPMSAPQAQQGVQGGAMAYGRSIGIPEKALQADMVFNGGKGIAEMMFKRGAPNMKVANGYAYDENTLGAGFMPSLSTSTNGQTSMTRIGADGLPVVSAPQGALGTFEAYKSAEAGLKPFKVYNPVTQREEFSNERAVAAGQPGALPDSATTPGSWQAANPGANLLAPRPGESDKPQIYAQALAQAQQRLTLARTPEDEARAKSDIAGIQGAMQQPGAAAPLRAGGNYAAGPSGTEKLAGDAGGKVNESWLKTSYEPVIASIGPVNETLTSIKVARSALGQMGGSGWGTEAKATAASVLSGLGVSSGNAKMFAANAQVFQNAAMDRLQSVLNQATGPQTDQDAARAAQSFAKLGNVTEANTFILDLSEAKAQRDKLKADFYQKALPIAQQKGNLQEIDREWASRAPSVFSMPSMKAWGIK